MTALRVTIAVLATSLCLAAVVNGQAKFDPNAPARKSDPTAPVKETITVGSEMMRGRSAMTDAAKALPPGLDVRAVYDAMEKVIQDNKQQNTDTDGFLLGARFGAWMNMVILADLEPHLVDTRLAERRARTYFNSYRKLQRQMGVSDAALCDLTGVICDGLKPEIEKYSKLK